MVSIPMMADVLSAYVHHLSTTDWAIPRLDTPQCLESRYRYLEVTELCLHSKRHAPFDI